MRCLCFVLKMKTMKAVYYPFPKKPFLSPEDVVAGLDVGPGEKVLDFGAGSGFWSIPIAEKVGKEGHVFVADAREENLAVIKAKAERLGLENLSFYLTPYEFSEAPIQTKVDTILFANVLSDIGSDDDIYKQAKKLAKEGTKMIIIDWRDGPGSLSGKKAVSEEDIIMKARKAGFEFKKLLSAGEHHTGLYFVYQK